MIVFASDLKMTDLSFLVLMQAIIYMYIIYIYYIYIYCNCLSCYIYIYIYYQQRQELKLLKDFEKRENGLVAKQQGRLEEKADIAARIAECQARDRV